MVIIVNNKKIIQKSLIMSKIAQAVSIFPYTRFWRVKGNSQISHTFGGLVSIGLFIVVGIICVMKIIQVFQMATITITSQTLINANPPPIGITTNQNNFTLQPFMAAVGPMTNNYTVGALYKNLSSSYQLMNLESCTLNHFSQLPDLQNTFNTLQLNKYLCLPLNQNYLMGGNWILGTQASVEFYILCLSQNNCPSDQGFTIFTLSSFANPFNNSYPWSISLQQTNNQFGQYMSLSEFNLNTNVINSDHSIFPLQNSQQQRVGFQLDQFINTQIYQSQGGVESSKMSAVFQALSANPANALIIQSIFQNSSSFFNLNLTQIQISSSPLTTTYNRSYMQILDALSYVGGIFNALIGIFFFMDKYGNAFFQLLCGATFFKNKAGGGFCIFSFVKLSIYSLLIKLKYKPNWELEQKRKKLRKTIKIMLDVVYLQRRIEFLQRALTVLFEEHHLKGLHLIRVQTQLQFDNSYKTHKLRKKLIKFFKNKDVQRINQNELFRYKIRSQSKANNLIESPLSQSIQNLDTKKDGTSDFQKMQSLKQLKIKDRQTLKKQALNMMQQQVRITVSGRCEEAEALDQVSDQGEQDDFNEEQIVSQLNNDLNRFVMEAESDAKDRRSKLIFEQLDKKLKTWLIEATKKQK